MRVKIHHSILLLIIIAAAYSCDTKRVFEQNVDIPKAGWHKDSVLFFSVDIQDTISAHSILINLRHESNYPKQNLYLFVNTIAPSGQGIRDTFEMMLADEKGQWFGSGLGDIWDFQKVFKYNVCFPASGNYRFEIEQAMRYEILPNIRSVGLTVETIN